MDRVNFKLLGTWKSSETGFSLHHHKDFECFVEQTGMWQALSCMCLNLRYQKYVKCLALSSILLLLTVYSEIIGWKCLKQSSALGVPLYLWVERTNFLAFIIFKKQQLIAWNQAIFFRLTELILTALCTKVIRWNFPGSSYTPFLWYVSMCRALFMTACRQ